MIKHIDYNDIYPIWKFHLWPDRKSRIEPTSAMVYKDGYDVKNLYQTPIFFAYIIDDNIAGVNSGHLCSDDSYRSRGLFVFDKYRKKGIGTELLLATIEQAKKSNASMIWSYPRSNSWTTYERAGFTLTSSWEEGESGLNAYCRLDF
jgi:GNAT superfamily N-acetyltransferase